MRPALEFCKKRNQGIETQGAEIGVALGDNASEILKSWPEVKLILVDNYWHSLDWATRTQERLSQFNDRVKWFIMDSQEASIGIEDNYLDFVYIDANHSYRGCYLDIKAWYPKVKPDGVLCGHDIAEPGVTKAVLDFNLQNNLLLQTKQCDWWIVKP